MLSYLLWVCPNIVQDYFFVMFKCYVLDNIQWIFNESDIDVIRRLQIPEYLTWYYLSFMFSDTVCNCRIPSRSLWIVFDNFSFPDVQHKTKCGTRLKRRNEENTRMYNLRSAVIILHWLCFIPPYVTK